MRIEITGRHLEVTDAIRQYTEEKCAKLPRYYDGILEIHAILTEESHVQEFEVELQVDAEKHEPFIARDRGDDIYACLDRAVNKATRQLSDFKDRLKNSKR